MELRRVGSLILLVVVLIILGHSVVSLYQGRFKQGMIMPSSMSLVRQLTAETAGSLTSSNNSKTKRMQTQTLPHLRMTGQASQLRNEAKGSR